MVLKILALVLSIFSASYCSTDERTVMQGQYLANCKKLEHNALVPVVCFRSRLFKIS